MRKQHKFTPRSGKVYDDHRELARLNKLVQNKQSRLRTQKGLETVDVNTRLMKEFDSRKEFNAYKKEMETFLDRQADFKVQNVHGVEIDYKDVMYGEKVARRINRQKEKQWDMVKNLPFKHQGYNTHMTVEERAHPKYGMGDVRYADFDPVQFDPNAYETKEGFERRLKTIRDVFDRPNWLKQKNQMYKDNYIQALENKIGDISEDLQNYLKTLPLDEFMKMNYSENNAHIDFIYDRLHAKDKLKELNRIWLKQNNPEGHED